MSIIDITQGTYPGLPADLLSAPSVPGYRRMRIEEGRARFYAGMIFGTFKELSVGAGATYVVRVTAATDILIIGSDVSLDAGGIRMGLYSGGTPGGTFSENLRDGART